MTDGIPVDLGCFSYLARARILRVDQYPEPDTGAEVLGVLDALAGDGPITAVTASALGLTCALAANNVGDDPAGHQLLQHLDRADVRHRLTATDADPTPELNVITDRAGTRTWFAHLAQAYTALGEADLTVLTAARLAYIDCYRIMTAAAVRAIDTAVRAQVPLFLNLGGDPLHPAVAHAAAEGDLVAVQTSLPTHRTGQAHDLAEHLARTLRPVAALVTLGPQGAIARTSTAVHQSPAGQGRPRHTHGAGAAFSAGFAAAYLAGHDLPTALTAACRTGTDHCAAITERPLRATGDRRLVSSSTV